VKDDGEVTPVLYSLQILKSRYCLCRALPLQDAILTLLEVSSSC